MIKNRLIKTVQWRGAKLSDDAGLYGKVDVHLSRLSMSFIRIVILLLCLSVAGVTMATAGEKNYKELYRQGAEHYKKGEFAEAIRLYSMAIDLRPNSVILLFRRGCAYEQNKQYDNAIRDLDKAIVLEPEYTEAYYVRGMAYVNKGQKQSAAGDFKKACDMGLADACNKLK